MKQVPRMRLETSAPDIANTLSATLCLMPSFLNCWEPLVKSNHPSIQIVSSKMPLLLTFVASGLPKLLLLWPELWWSYSFFGLWRSSIRLLQLYSGLLTSRPSSMTPHNSVITLLESPPSAFSQSVKELPYLHKSDHLL